MGTPQLNKWLAAAAYAKADPTLIPNHRGTVDRALKAIRAENTALLEKIGDAPTLEDVVTSLRTELVAIDAALQVYA